MNDYLEKTDRQNLPTAIFCASDALAQGCIEALKDCGLQVPDDISVIGFDDLLTAQIMSPPLTTIRQPFQEMGRRSVEHLMDLIPSESDFETGLETDKPDFPGVADILPVELVIRLSVRPVIQV
jgi:LacI family transcriptional regulator